LLTSAWSLWWTWRILTEGVITFMFIDQVFTKKEDPGAYWTIAVLSIIVNGSMLLGLIAVGLSLLSGSIPRAIIQMKDLCRFLATGR